MDKIEEEYRKKYSEFETFTSRLGQLFETILKSGNISYHLVESRTKSIESYCEKINRKQGKYNQPLNQITDICALRILVYYIDDLEKIEKVLRENFLIDEANSYDAKNNMTENEFGYLSSHFVVSLKTNRSKLPEWTAYAGLKAEIQVRTVLQHAWAAISHQLEYKKNYEIPSVLKRKLYRLAGLIELADEEFQEAREKHNAVEIAIKENIALSSSKTLEEINLNTIKNYFSQNPQIENQIDKIAISAEFEINNADFHMNERNGFFSEIIKICKIQGISTIAEFDKVLKKELNGSAQKKLSDLYKIDNTDWTASTEFIVLLLMIMNLNKIEIKNYNNRIWAKSVWKRFIEIADQNE